MRRVVVASTLDGEKSIRNHRTHIAGLAAYAMRHGHPLDPVKS